MSTTKTEGIRDLAPKAWKPAPSMSYFGAPQVMFSPNEDGSATDAELAAAAAAAEAAETAAAETAALEEAEAEAAAAELAAAGKDTKTLAAENAKLVKEVMTKKAAAKLAAATLQETSAALAAYEGVDPAKVKALLKAEKDAELASAEAAGDYDRLKLMMVEQHNVEKAALETTNATLLATNLANEQLIANLTVGNDFASSAYIRDDLTLSPTKARVIFGSHFEILDGKTVGFDKPAGKPGRTMLVDGSGNPVAFDVAFKRIIEADDDKDTMLKVKVTPGSRSNTTSSKEKVVIPTDHLHGASRIAAALNAGK